MASYEYPSWGMQYIFYVALIDQTNGALFKVDPTIAAGDVKVTKDTGATSDLTVTPVANPAGSSRVQVALLESEMEAGNITVTFHDAAGDEWADLSINIQPEMVKLIASGESSGGSNNTLVDIGLGAATDIYDGAQLQFVGGVYAGAKRYITGYDGLGNLTFSPPTAGAISSGQNYNIIGNAGVDAEAILGTPFTEGATPLADNLSTYWGNAGAATARTVDDIDVDLSAAAVDAIWDEELDAGSHNVPNSAARRLRQLEDFGVYEGGAIWIDTVNGTAGTTDFENGTVYSPVDSIDDAMTIAGSVGLSIFHILPGSAITLAASADNFAFTGYDYSVNLDGQSCSGASFLNAAIIGNDDGSNATTTDYVQCQMGNNTLGKHRLRGCQLSGDIVLAEATDYFWDQCHSGVAGTGTPSVNMEAVAETKNLSIRHYSGGIEFRNFGAGSGTHTASVEGFGQVVLNANCAGGTIAIRGTFTVTDNAGGAVTLSDSARLDQTVVADLQSVLGTALVESSAVGALADNISQFYDIDPTTTKTVDDVGTAVVSLPQTFPAGSDGAQAGTVLPATPNSYTGTTVVDDGVELSITNGSAEIIFNVGASNEPAELNCIVDYTCNTAATMTWQVYDNVTGPGWVTLKTIVKDDIRHSYTYRIPEADRPNLVDGSNDVRMRWVADGHASALAIIDYATTICVTESGSIPTVTEIAIGVDLQLTGTHGEDSWKGILSLSENIEAVDGTFTIFTLPATVDYADNVMKGHYLLIKDVDGNNFGGEMITAWNNTSKQITIANPMTWVEIGDRVEMMVNSPGDIDAILGTRLTETTAGRLAANLSTFYDNADAVTTRTVDDVDNVYSWNGAGPVDALMEDTDIWSGGGPANEIGGVVQADVINWNGAGPVNALMEDTDIWTNGGPVNETAGVVQANLVQVEGQTTNYTRTWLETFSDIWAAVRGVSTGTAGSQVHKHADGTTTAFTVTTESDGDRGFVDGP